MFDHRTGFVAVCLTAALALHATSASARSDQEKGAATPAAPAADGGDYSGTDAEGNYQKALDAAIKAAHEAVSHAGGKVISDAMVSWQVVSVSGTHGGIMGKRDVTVTVHVKR
jgi:hypothetical protein